MALANDPRWGQIGSKSLAKALAVTECTVATVPSAAENKGRIIAVTNGASGAPCLAYSNGTSWLRVLLGAAVASS